MREFTLPPERDFAGALAALADEGRPPDPGRLADLSGPSRADVALWESRWPSVGLERRRWLGRELALAAERDFALHYQPLFRIALKDPDAVLRATAIDAFWESEDPRLADRFLRLLREDPDATVRARAAAALAVFVQMAEMETLPPEQAQALVRGLLDAATDSGEDVEVRRHATASVGYIDGPEVRALIDDHLASAERELVAGALVAMGRSGLGRWEPFVLAYLEAADAMLRLAATQAAGHLGSRKAVPLLAELAASDELAIQAEAIWALGEIGGRQARRALEDLADRLDEEALLERVDEALATLALTDEEDALGLLRFDPPGSGEGGGPAGGRRRGPAPGSAGAGPEGAPGADFGEDFDEDELGDDGEDDFDDLEDELGEDFEDDLDEDELGEDFGDDLDGDEILEGPAEDGEDEAW